MTEIFKPRENMVFNKADNCWKCSDENGHLVCDGGPSLIYTNGFWSFWNVSDGYHRLDGPATSEGQWWIRGQNVTKEIRDFAKENDIDLDNLTDADRVMIALKFS